MAFKTFNVDRENGNTATSFPAREKAQETRLGNTGESDSYPATVWSRSI